jgi:hypothetical protein
MAKTKSSIGMTSRRTEALARRLAPGGNVFGAGSKAIPLKEPGWQTRFFNAEVHDQRHYQATQELGWMPVTPEELPGKPEEFGLRVNESGFLVRGAKGNELFCKMAAEDAAEVLRRKTIANMRGIGSASKTKDDVANAVAGAHGSEAADYIHKHIQGTVVDSRGPLDAA